MARRRATQPTHCPQIVSDLVQRFDQHRQAYQHQSYNETQVRREFIDPLFKALGWDIDNEAGLAEAYKDVIHEDAIKVGGATKAPDYCFRVGGTRKFFVEAKKPAVGVADDPGPAYQLRRYAWSAKLPLSIVTDFEEFAVYDCRIRPKASDKASTARVLYFTFDQYPEKWEEIASIFSKDAILKGSFDKYAQSARRKRGTAEVDAEFLKEIGAWRKTLASHLALRNGNLSVRELNYAVAKIIDRIIFLRMCEDRGIETYAQLRDLLNGSAVYGRLVELFRRADERYNSGLFHFQTEKGRPETPDELTPHLTIDDKVLKDILRTLYYPESPYEFSVIPVEILGQVYEQFLGQIIRLTKGHQARVEDKPEVKKAGGVYYTPKYIVDYIVKHTVGKLLEERVPGVGGPGSGGSGDDHGDQDVSGSGGLAEGDGPGGVRLPADRDTAHRGTLRTDEPDPASGGFDPGQHRRGPRADSSQGVYPSPVDRPGITDGSGDPPDHRRPSEAARSRQGPAGVGSSPAGRKASKRSHRRASKKGLPPGTRSPIPGPLRILDPACGSGSFLLGAYQFLLDWHLDYYSSKDPDKWTRRKNPPIYQIQTPGTRPLTPGPQSPTPTFRLSIREKKRILLNHIYGVDIDPQAVEVTKLSLLLKVLENETAETLGQTLRLFHERALPDLAANIKCGNSLIGPDFYDGKQLDLFGEEERYRINAFDWRAEFPEVFGDQGSGAGGWGSGTTTERATGGGRASTPETRSGFDAVIGNPPYIRVRHFKDIHPEQVDYLEAHFICATHVWDIYLLIFERALSVCRTSGRCGFIVPIQTLHQPNCESLRRVLCQNTNITNVTDCSDLVVFKGPIVKNCILVAENGTKEGHHIAVSRPQATTDFAQHPDRHWPQSHVASNPGFSLKADLLSPKRLLCSKLADLSYTLGELCYTTFGLRSCAKGKGKGGKDRLITDNTDAPHARPYLEGRDIGRYSMRPTGRYIRYLPDDMYSPRTPALFEAKKLVSQTMLSKMRLVATLDDQGYYVEQSLLCIIPHGTLTPYVDRPQYPLEFILGIVNSTLSSFYYAVWIIDYSLGGGLVHATPGSQGKLLIPKVVPTKTAGIVGRVKNLLDQHKQLAAAKTPTDKTAIQRQIDATDNRIDKLVYELYSLTDDEIAIVEESTAEPSHRKG